MGKTDPSAPRHLQQSQVLVPRDTPGVVIERPLPVFGYYDQVCAGIAPTTLPPASDGQPAAPAPESPGPEPSTVETTAP